MPRAHRNKPRILAVDDEAGILRLLVDVLSRHGFEVLTDECGEAAIETYRHQRNPVDLVLLDVQMDPWDGPQTLAELRRINPHVRAAFMTGSPGRYTAEELLGFGALRIVEKPFLSLANLVATLDELVSESGSVQTTPAPSSGLSVRRLR